jgi:hypothetical protein
MNNKKYIENIVLEQYYKLAVDSLFEQTDDGYKLRSIRIEPLTDKQRATLKKIPGGVQGFQIIAKGKNLKNNITHQQIVRSIQSSRQYGDGSAYGQGLSRLFIVDKVDLKKKENRKQIWVIFITKLKEDDIKKINKLPKIGNSSYIIPKSNFPSVNTELANVIKVVSAPIKVNIKKTDNKIDPPTKEDEKESDEVDETPPTSAGVPSLSPMKLISLPKGQPKASDTYGFTNLKSAFTGDRDGSYAKTKPTLLTFLKPFQSIPGFGFTSTKRSSKLSRAGNISDHWDGNPTSYGVDIALKDMQINVGQETDKDVVKTTIGDKIFLSIMKAIGKGIPTKGGIFKANPITGFRIQVIWRTADHYDHIHVGLRNEVAFEKFSKMKQNNQDPNNSDKNTTDNTVEPNDNEQPGNDNVNIVTPKLSDKSTNNIKKRKA